MEIALNKSHKAVFEDTNRFIVSYGGAGSGKSVSVAQKILLRAIEEENHRFIIVRKVANTLRVSVFQLFKDLIVDLGLYDQFTINKSDMTITYKANNSSLLFFGLDNVERLKSIAGITGVWIEEASECEQNDIMELNRRLRGATKYYKQIILTFNPISHLHWLKAHFFDNEASSASIYHSTYLDNSFIDDEYKAQIEEIKSYDIQQYNIYALGEWGVLNTNIVYHNFVHTQHTTQLTIDDFDVLHCGVDFNVGGSVCVICGIRDNKVYAVDGWAVYDTQQIADKLSGVAYKNKKIIVYPDASGGNDSANASRSSIEILQDAGLTINAHKANPAVRDRINAMNRKMARGELFVNDRLEKLMHSLQTQAYKDDGKPEKAKEHKGGAFDDWNDALGYFVSYKYPIQTYARISGGFQR